MKTLEDSTTPDATAAAIPDEGPQEVTQEAGIPITKVVDGGPQLLIKIQILKTTCLSDSV